MRRQNEGLVTCVERQVPRDHASSFCRDIAIKVAFWAWHRMESSDDRQSQHLSWAITSFGTRPQTQQWALAAQALSGQGVPEPLTRTKPEASAASCHYLTLGVTRVVIKLSFCCACAHQYQALPLFFFFFSFLGEGRRVSREQNSNLGAPKFRVYQLESKWPLTLRRNSVIHQVCTEHFRATRDLGAGKASAQAIGPQSHVWAPVSLPAAWWAETGNNQVSRYCEGQ